MDSARYQIRPLLSQTQPPSLGDKFRRAVWTAVWATLYRWSPTPLHGWRRGLLRLFGAKVGTSAHPYPSAWIWAPWNLVMAPGSCLGPGVDCYSAGKVRLGANSVISQRAYLCAASHNHTDPAFSLLVGPIDIGVGAWIAAEAFIGPGVSIGDRAVVGARAVVTKSVPSRAIVAGNPASIIGTRPADSQTDAQESPKPLQI